MKGLLIPREGPPEVLDSISWSIEVVREVLGVPNMAVSSFGWPHPPKGTRYSVYQRPNQGPAKHLSLVERGPSLVLAHDGLFYRSLTTGDLLYLATFVAIEQELLAIPAAPARREVTGA